MVHKYEIKYSTMKNGKPVEKIVEMPVNSSKLPKLTRWKVRALVVAVALIGILLLYASLSSSATNFQVKETVAAWEARSNTTAPSDEDLYRSDKIRYKHTKRHLPQCIIIGCRKAGTRALLSFLNVHPQIQTAKKEMHFFDDDEEYANGLEWYRKKMPYAFSDQITIEKTPAYFSTYEVPKRIAKMNSTIKLLLIVRDPTDRTISDYLQIHLNKVARDKPTKSFEERVIDPDTGLIDTHYPPLVRSLYYQYMWNWLQSFNLDQFLVLSGEELVKNPLPELRRVEQFLHLEPVFSEDMFYFNETRGFYCIRNETYDPCLRESKGREHPAVDPKVIHQLRQYFAPYNEEFYKLVKFNFGWPKE